MAFLYQMPEALILEEKMKERIFYTELAYILGIALLAVGTAMMERADFGVSMVVAPAYLLYLKVSQNLPFFSFGMAEYMLQGILLVMLILILRKFRLAYLFSFATAVIYGFALDGAMWVVGRISGTGVAFRLFFYVLGFLGCALGVSLLFHTYISPEVYELWVKVMSRARGIDIHKYKTVYDCVSCLIAVVLSFLFFGFGHFEGVKIGTIFCALLNGYIIGLFARMLEKTWDFRDGLPLRSFFE